MGLRATTALLASLSLATTELERWPLFDTDHTVLLRVRDADARVFLIADDTTNNVLRIRHEGALYVARPATAFHGVVREALEATTTWTGYVKDFSRPRTDVIAFTLVLGMSECYLVVQAAR